MHIQRTIQVESDTFIANDIITIKTSDNKIYTATAIKVSESNALFILNEILDTQYCMNDNNNILDWDESLLRIKTNSEIIQSFPKEIRNIMIPFPNGDLFQPPMADWIFGEDNLEYFNNQINIIAKRKDTIESYWLMDNEAASVFLYVNEKGKLDKTVATCTHIGFRPVFILKQGAFQKKEKTPIENILSKPLITPIQTTLNIPTIKENIIKHDIEQKRPNIDAPQSAKTLQKNYQHDDTNLMESIKAQQKYLKPTVLQNPITIRYKESEISKSETKPENTIADSNESNNVISHDIVEKPIISESITKQEKVTEEIKEILPDFDIEDLTIEKKEPEQPKPGLLEGLLSKNKKKKRVLWSPKI